MLRVMGIVGIIVGVVMMAMTGLGAVFTTSPAKGYLVGGVFVVAGVFRFIRGMNR